jgi:hypothetical protein
MRLIAAAGSYLRFNSVSRLQREVTDLLSLKRRIDAQIGETA